MLWATGVYPGMHSDCFNIFKSVNATYHISNLKNKNVIISTDAQKAFGKIRDPFMIKLSSN